MGQKICNYLIQTVIIVKKENKNMSSKTWIKWAIKHPWALHRELGVPEGEKIPQSKLNAAASSTNPTLRRRAILAKTLSKFKK